MFWAGKRNVVSPSAIPTIFGGAPAPSSLAAALLRGRGEIDADLRAIIEAREALPESVKARIVAIVGEARGGN